MCLLNSSSPPNSSSEFITTGYGGFGFTSRMWGLTLDNVKSIDMVLSNGSIVTASDKSSSGLFWVRRVPG